MVKDILLIAHFSGELDNKGNNRFNYLAKLLSESNFNVELVTSDFSHNQKKKRTTKMNATRYKVTCIPEPSYNNNVSLKRFYSHHIMSVNLGKYLRKRNPPDIIYCSVPSLDVAKVAAKYSKHKNIRFIIDIQDLWPEAFKMVFNAPLINDLFFCPMTKKADYIYKAADDIVAVSKTYLERAQRANKEKVKAISVFLGTELETFDKLAKDRIDKPDREIWLAYVGTLGHSYDIEMVVDALGILSEKGINNIKFKVMGDGPLKTRFESYARERKICAEFTGRLDYGEMIAILSACDIAINPIKSGSAGSIIYKVGDYAAAGLPVINTQENKEYRDLLDEYEAGFNCINGNSIDVADKMLILAKSGDLRNIMGRNNRILAEEKFDRKETYMEIVDLIKST